MLIMAILKKSRNLGDCHASLSDSVTAGDDASVICCLYKLVSNSNKSSNKTFKETNRYKMLKMFESHSSPFLFCQFCPLQNTQAMIIVLCPYFALPHFHVLGKRDERVIRAQLG